MKPFSPALGLPLSIALLLCACAEPAEEPAAPSLVPAMQRKPIINGTRDTSAEHDAVVQLHYDAWGIGYYQGICTGTLIAESIVLTAAHCLWVRDCDEETDTCQLETDPSRFRIMVGNNQTTRPQHHVAAIHAHPDYDQKRISNDIGLIVLSSPITNVVPIPALPDEAGLRWTEADVGASVTYVGFGLTNPKNPYSSGTRMQVSDAVDLVCLQESGCTYRGGRMPNKTFCHDMQPGGTCSGDSGGPAFLTRDGVTFTAGVTSFGDEDCSFLGCSTNVSAFMPWIESVVEGGSDLALGERCFMASQCQSGFCAQGVCCDRACRNTPCEACKRALGASQDGVCGVTTAACDDGDACTLEDKCLDGVCTGGEAKACPGAMPCLSASRCLPETGECGPLENLPAGTPCDDGNACTLDDQCLHGQCLGSGSVYCRPAGACEVARAGFCNAATGQCEYEALSDGTSCGDGKSCRAGACVEESASGCGCTESGAASLPSGLFALLGLFGLLRGRREA